MKREYSFLLLDYDMPDFIKEMQKSIGEDELYIAENEANDDYGLSKECHITLVPCLGLDVDINDLKKYLSDLSEYDTLLTDVSIFNNEDYDVLKCTAKCPKAEEVNKNILKDFETFTEYKEYKPHMTIAYLKKGCADKYAKEMLDKIKTIKPISYNYSTVDKNTGENLNIRFDKLD